MRQLGDFCQKEAGHGCWAAKTADVRSGLLLRGCAIETKQPRGWFPATQSCSLIREPSPERDLEAQKTEALGGLVFWAPTAPPNDRQLLEAGPTPGWAPTGVAQAG